ncbi:MAG: hypothetical protein NC223_11810 [Butyrivibrio sp.]|nr:hypothetical protein [Butyrivibrio sp.]
MTEAKRIKKTRKRKKFWLGYGIYMGILAVLAAVLLVYVWNVMKEYESAQPVYVLEGLLDELKAGRSDAVADVELGKFESEAADNYADTFAQSVKGKDLDYKVKLSGSYLMTYSLLDGDKVVAEADLRAENERSIMGILSISDWRVDCVRANVPSGDKGVRITVPYNYTVRVNGVALTEEERSGEPQAIEGTEYVAEYTEPPKRVTYEVNGLINEPSVEVSDGTGLPVDISGASDGSEISLDYAESEMPQELKDYVFAAARDYSNFFSKDIEGCYESTACIQRYFPAGSYYMDLAEQYRTGDMWMYSAHSAPEFRDVTVSEYVRYSDDCFSCRVAFDKYMVLTLSGEPRTERNDQIYYYVNIDGSWLIADMKSKA